MPVNVDADALSRLSLLLTLWAGHDILASTLISHLSKDRTLLEPDLDMARLRNFFHLRSSFDEDGQRIDLGAGHVADEFRNMN
jgi:hypothetical protein